MFVHKMSWLKDEEMASWTIN